MKSRFLNQTYLSSQLLFFFNKFLLIDTNVWHWRTTTKSSIYCYIYSLKATEEPEVPVESEQNEEPAPATEETQPAEEAAAEAPAEGEAAEEKPEGGDEGEKPAEGGEEKPAEGEEKPAEDEIPTETLAEDFTYEDYVEGEEVNPEEYEIVEVNGEKKKKRIQKKENQQGDGTAEVKPDGGSCCIIM